MYCCLPLAATLIWQLLSFVHAASNTEVLVPFSEDNWDTTSQGKVRRRSSNSSGVILQESEQFIWGPDAGSTQNLYVNMTLSTGDEELVLSMERFAGELKSVDCGSNMNMTFISNSTFQSAIASWSWVNFNENRTFILIANYAGCSPDKARQPWVVSNVDYDTANLVVHLNATQKSWPEIAHTFSMDFGKYKPSPPAGQKRSLVDITQSFSIDLNYPLPQALLPDTSMSDYLPDSVLANFDFEIDCDSCGSKGSLELQGHVESDIWNGISDLTITVIPHGIEAVLALKVIATGTVPTSSWGHQWHLFNIGIPGLSIPDVLELGPNLDFSAGFNITKLSGSVSLEAGVTGAIPDTARAEIDLVQKTGLDIHGWTPVFTPIPFNLDLEVDLDFELYVAIAVQVSLDALSTGFDTDLQLKIPDITVNTVGSYNKEGVCPGSKDPIGVQIDAAAGAQLTYQAYDEVDGAKSYFLNDPLFQDLSAFTWSDCLAFGSAS